MSPLSFGLRVPPCERIDMVADFAREAESEGIDVIWIPDSQFMWRDAWTAAALVAQRTERVGIGVAVTNFETRHVSVTCSAMLAIDELSGGRLRVAFGTGDSAVKSIGRRPTSLRDMRAGVTNLRRLLAGDEVAWPTTPGTTLRRMHMRHTQRRPIPIYVAASGPKSLELAGEIADGIIIAAGVSPALIDHALSMVDRGAQTAGRSLTDLDLIIAAHTFITGDISTAVRSVKPLCLSMAQLGGSRALRAVGIEIDVPHEIDGIYPDVTHAESWDLAIQIAERYIGEEAAYRFASNLSLAGTPEEVLKRLDGIRSTGVDGVYMMGVSSYRLPTDQLQSFVSTIRPSVTPAD